MYKILLLLGCWLIASGSIYQSPPAGFPDTPAITENSVGRVRIGMRVTKLKDLYKGCTFTPAHLATYGFDDTSNKLGGVLVSSAGQKLFLYFEDWQTRKKVAGILVFHPAYKTVKGIHVGFTAGQLRAALPAVRVGPSELMEGMQIAAVATGESEKMGLQYIFYKQGTIGKNKDSIEPSAIAATKAKISWIQVFPN
jgi:hypothetical protein